MGGNMEFNHLPVIDWELATKLAGNKKEYAEEMLGLLIKSLPEDRLAINQCYLTEKYVELLQRAHKLHGALCYCGLPRLKAVVRQLETELKNNIMDNLPSLLDQLNLEINLLLERPILEEQTTASATQVKIMANYSWNPYVEKMTHESTD